MKHEKKRKIHENAKQFYFRFVGKFSLSDNQIISLGFCDPEKRRKKTTADRPSEYNR